MYRIFDRLALENAAINLQQALRLKNPNLFICKQKNILISPQSFNLIKIFVTVSLNSVGLRPGPLTGSQNFFPLDLSY